MPKPDDYVRNYRNATIRLSDGSDIKGKVNIGDRFHRLSDLIRHPQDAFITVVSEEPAEGSKKAYIINKQYIIWCRAED